MEGQAQELWPYFCGLARSGRDKHRSLIFPHGKNQQRTKVQFNQTMADAASHAHPGLGVFCLKYTISTGLMDGVKCVSKYITMGECSGDCTGQKPEISRFHPERASKRAALLGSGS